MHTLGRLLLYHHNMKLRRKGNDHSLHMPVVMSMRVEKCGHGQRCCDSDGQICQKRERDVMVADDVALTSAP